MCPLPPREVLALLWEWDTSFPTSLAQGESPTCSAPQKSQPRCAVAAVERLILMHIPPTSPREGLVPSLATPPGHQLRSAATRGPPAACREAGLGCFSVGHASGFSSIPTAR